MGISAKANLIGFIGFLWAAQIAGQQFTISTIAGGVPPRTPAVATTASIGGPVGVAVDAAGNVYFTSDNYCVFKLDTTGNLTLIAGNSRPGYSGDGGPATSAQFNFGPLAGVAVDAAGYVYIADSYNHSVRRVSPAGVITTAAGIGVEGNSGDAGLATAARLSYPTGVAVDAAGNLYIADSGNGRVRRVSPSGVISTPPGALGLSLPGSGMSVAVDGAGNVYVSDRITIQRVSPSGTVTTIAGGSGSSADLAYPGGLAVDATGIVYVADTNHHRVRRMIGPDLFATVAGAGEEGFYGDGGLATMARLSYPVGVAVDAAGNLYVADRYNYRIRRVSPSGMLPGIITTAAGNGLCSHSGDGGPAVSAQIQGLGVAVDSNGNLFFAEYSTHRVRRVSPSGLITTVAGSGVSGYSGDGGPATSARLYVPYGVAVDGAGNLYIADTGNNRVRRVSPDGIINTVAGSGMGGFSGDGGPATDAQLRQPIAVTVDTTGNLYVGGDYRVRRVSPTGIITTAAGTGTGGYSGDDGRAVNARLASTFGLAVDGGGTLYIADASNYRIRRVSPDGFIDTVAGSATEGFSGDGGPATSAALNHPVGVAVDGIGNLYISDVEEHRIRRVSPSGIIATIAGNGGSGYSGDGGPAVSAQLGGPRSLAVDSAGRIYCMVANAVRMLAPPGACVTSATPTSLTALPGGGALVLNIQATAGCGWAITSLPAWITASATSGVGPSTVTLTVTANWQAPRSATISAAGTAVAISQDVGGVCVPPSISPLSQSFGSAGGKGSFTVSTRAGCGWTAVSQVAWITITGSASGSGERTVDYQILPNTAGAPRSGTITIAGSTFTVQQASSNLQCSYSASSTDLGVAATGGTIVVSIHTEPGCAWSVSGLPSWLTVSGDSQGSGPANVSLVAASNPDGARSASVSIGGVSVPIRQFDSSACGGSSSCVARALPHLAAGSEWTTSLFAANSGPITGAFSISFYGGDGSSLALPFTGGGNLSTLSDSIPAQGRKDYEAGGANLPLQGGWGLLVAEKSIAAQVTFRRATAGGNFYEASVPASEGYSGFIIPFDAGTFPPTGGALYTGFAIANLNPNAAAHVTCTARDQWGTVVPNAVTIPELKPSGHHANNLFPALTSKRGTLDCTADTFVTAIALRFIGTEAFSTLPVIVK